MMIGIQISIVDLVSKLQRGIERTPIVDLIIFVSQLVLSVKSSQSNFLIFMEFDSV